MQISMFSSWQVRCGIADYTSHLIDALRTVDDTQVNLVPFDRQTHPRADYVQWGRAMNTGTLAHIQHEYTFFGYLFPWQNHFGAFVSQIKHPIVITKHVSFDGPLLLSGRGANHLLRQMKWAMYNRWLGPYATRLNRDTFDLAQQIIVLSARLKEQLIERGIRDSKIHVIPPGVPVVPRTVNGDHLRKAWNWQTKHIITQFGFIAPAKGHRIALDALAQLPSDYVLLIAGGLRRENDHDALRDIQHRILELRLEERVRITGYLDEANVSAHLNASDILIFPYSHADFSYSVLTGLAFQAAPVIASDIDAHRELAGSCPALALFRSGDPADLAGKIQDILHDPERRETMRRQVAQFSRDMSWQSIARKTLQVYHHALEAGHAHHP